MGIDERTFSYLAAHSDTFLNRSVTTLPPSDAYLPKRD
jgi:hypothetical protein